jgi:hypothetical protein
MRSSMDGIRGTNTVDFPITLLMINIKTRILKK